MIVSEAMIFAGIDADRAYSKQCQADGRIGVQTERFAAIIAAAMRMHSEELLHKLDGVRIIKNPMLERNAIYLHPDTLNGERDVVRLRGGPQADEETPGVQGEAARGPEHGGIPGDG